MNKAKAFRLLEVLLAAALVGLVGYLAPTVIKVTQGVSKTVEPARHQVRLQIVNATSEDGLAGRLAGKLKQYNDGELEILTVDIERSNINLVPESFLLSRDNDEEAVRLLAERLGIATERISYKPLQMNQHHVSVTLVLGEDHADLLPAPKPEEN